MSAIHLSVLGTTLEALAPPEVAPQCPREGCEGRMEPSGQTAVIPAAGNEPLAHLRCQECREARWYRQHQAYALLPEGLVF